MWVVCKCLKLLRCEDLWGVSVVGSNPTTPTSQAGDRPDGLIEELARGAWQIGLDQVLVSELAHYHRGREHGEVYDIIRGELRRDGARDDQVHHFEEETEALEFALDWAQPGDLVIMLALGGAAPVHKRLRELGAQ